MSGRPTTSNAWSAPRPVIAYDASRRGCGAGLDGIRRAARQRELELRRIQVDGHDRIGVRQPERRDDLQTDAPTADHGGRLARLDARGVSDCAERGDDSAAEERRLPERKLLR